MSAHDVHCKARTGRGAGPPLRRQAPRSAPRPCFRRCAAARAFRRRSATGASPGLPHRPARPARPRTLKWGARGIGGREGVTCTGPRGILESRDPLKQARGARRDDRRHPAAAAESARVPPAPRGRRGARRGRGKFIAAVTRRAKRLAVTRVRVISRSQSAWLVPLRASLNTLAARASLPE